MTLFSDSFTQGGQTQLHKLRMIRQVIGITVKVGGVIFLLVFIGLTFKNHGWQDFWFLLCSLKAWARVECLSFLPFGVFDTCTIINRDGSVHSVLDSWLITQDHLFLIRQAIYLSLLKKLCQSLFIALVSIGILSWFWIHRGKDKQQTKVLSGFEVVDPKTLNKLVKKQGASVYTLGGVSIPKGAEVQHMMITGTTGSGKSNTLHHLLTQIRAQGDQAIVVDTTGDIVSRFYEKDTDILLNPLDKRSKHWDLWSEIISDSHIEEMAESIIPDNRLGDSFWIHSARQVFCEGVRYLKREGAPSYKELLNMTLSLPLKELHARLKNTPASSLLDPSMDKTALSIRATLAPYLRAFKTLEETCQTNRFSLMEFAHKESSQWLFLSCLPDQRECLRPLLSAWLSLVIKGMMQRQRDHSFISPAPLTWILIDELASLNRLPSLLMGLAEARKYGGCFVLGFQDLSQLDEIYGHSLTKSLSNLTGTKVLFRCVDSEVATRISRYLGEQEKQEASESISFGAHQMRDGVNLSTQKQTKPTVTASQIIALKDLEGFIKFPGSLPTTKVTFPYLNLDKKDPAFIAKESLFKDSNLKR